MATGPIEDITMLLIIKDKLPVQWLPKLLDSAIEKKQIRVIKHILETQGIEWIGGGCMITRDAIKRLVRQGTPECNSLVCDLITQKPNDCLLQSAVLDVAAEEGNTSVLQHLISLKPACPSLELSESVANSGVNAGKMMNLRSEDTGFLGDTSNTRHMKELIDNLAVIIGFETSEKTRERDALNLLLESNVKALRDRWSKSQYQRPFYEILELLAGPNVIQDLRKTVRFLSEAKETGAMQYAAHLGSSLVSSIQNGHADCAEILLSAGANYPSSKALIGSFRGASGTNFVSAKKLALRYLLQQREYDQGTVDFLRESRQQYRDVIKGVIIDMLSADGVKPGLVQTDCQEFLSNHCRAFLKKTFKQEHIDAQGITSGMPNLVAYLVTGNDSKIKESNTLKTIKKLSPSLDCTTPLYNAGRSAGAGAGDEPSSSQ